MEGSRRAGMRDVELLGLWVGEAEGAKFWLGVLTELKNRGVQDVLIASVDGLVGFPEAIETVFPKAQVQLCIVHMVRGSLKSSFQQGRVARGNGGSFVSHEFRL